MDLIAYLAVILTPTAIPSPIGGGIVPGLPADFNPYGAIITALISACGLLVSLLIWLIKLILERNNQQTDFYRDTMVRVLNKIADQSGETGTSVSYTVEMLREIRSLLALSLGIATPPIPPRPPHRRQEEETHGEEVVTNP